MLWSVVRRHTVPMSTTLSMTAPPDVYRRRRAQLASALTRPLALFAGRAPRRTCATTPYPFRADSNYLYFGGPPALEGAALIIEPGGDGASGSTLVRVPPGPDDALWIGLPPDDADLLVASGIEAAVSPEELSDVLAGRATAAVVPECEPTRALARDNGLLVPSDDELREIIHLRLIKDNYELAAMRRAAEVTISAHLTAMAACRPGVTEAQIAAAFGAAIAAHEHRPSFTPIITMRGEVLHAHGHPNTLSSGALLLVDGGAEEPGGYACDVTRTFPVDGAWGAVQRPLYDAVLMAMRAAIDACVPTTRYREVHDIAGRTLCTGLVDIGLLKGDPLELAGRYAHTLFFPHGVGHLIGLDVHDMEDFGDLAGYAPGRSRRQEFGNKFLRLDRDLEPGMCVTIEPGFYMVPAIWETAEIWEPFKDAVNRPMVEELLASRFGGIRIEETVAVRAADGPEILTAGLPSNADAVVDCVGR